MAVTIRDVARYCRMSIATVSKVFNGYPDISEATRRQVMEAAREIGYRPNALARALKTNRSYNLGVLFVDENVSGLTHPFFAAVLNAFKSESEAHGYDITFINHNIGTMDMTFLEHCHYRNVDGVCLACVDFRSPEVVALVNSDIPCVTIDHRFENRPCVMSDNETGMRLLVDRAVELGHRRVAYIHGQRNSLVTETRIKSFLDAMQAHGLGVPEGYLTGGRYDDVMANRPRLWELMNRPDPPTCVLLPDDAAYFGALDLLWNMGKQVPRDISLGGYDGVRAVYSVHPRVTTVRQDNVGMGRQAARSLIDHVEHPVTAPNDVTMIPTELLEGDSLGRPKE